MHEKPEPIYISVFQIANTRWLTASKYSTFDKMTFGILPKVYQQLANHTHMIQ